MSHTLHRLGNPVNLAHDYVVFAMSAKGINEADSAPKLTKFLELALEHDPVCFGDMKTGNSLTTSREEIFGGIQDISIVHAVFTDQATVTQLLARLREADLGVSIVVSGLVDQARQCAHQAGLNLHTVEYSLGIFGRTDKLPGQRTLELTTMCGHAQVASGLVEQTARSVGRGKLSPEEGGRKLASACVCGVFNPVRAAELLKKLAEELETDAPPQPGQTVTPV